MQIIDARGWECPKPIIETLRLMDSTGLTEVTTIVDNKIAVDNMMAFAKSQNCECVCEEKDGVYHMHLKLLVDAPAVAGDKDNLTIVITSNKLGCGGEELGENLMKSYIYALSEAMVKPKILIFMNSGVFLTTNGSPVIESLEILEASDVNILSCGACLKYYELESEVAIGSVSNMYDFVNKMNNTPNTIVL